DELRPQAADGPQHRVVKDEGEATRTGEEGPGAEVAVQQRLGRRRALVVRSALRPRLLLGDGAVRGLRAVVGAVLRRRGGVGSLGRRRGRRLLRLLVGLLVRLLIGVLVLRVVPALLRRWLLLLLLLLGPSGGGQTQGQREGAGARER